jgi:hypothetical protein
MVDKLMEHAAPAAAAAPVKVTTHAEAQALPPGARYVAPDGKVRVTSGHEARGLRGRHIVGQ